MTDDADPSSADSISADEERIDEIATSYLEALRAGKAPPIEVITSAYPDLAKQLADLLPMMAAMEGLKTDETPLDTTVPDEIDDYDIIRLIGSGGMGRVFEATAPDDTRVAIKVVHTHLLRKRNFIVRILREAHAGLRIKHPNVIRTLKTSVYENDVGYAPYVVMEYLEGQTLSHLIEESGPLPERLVRHIGESVAAGLEAIHSAGVVHRDVKPDNVIITPNETIKIMDLGIAKLDDEVYRVSQTGEFVGSLLYAAPEQLRGGTVDERSDIYALGLLLFELLTGAPVRQSTDGERFDLGLALGTAPSPRTYRDDLSPFLEALVSSLLAREPDERPQTATIVKEALHKGEESDWWNERIVEAEIAPIRDLQVERLAPMRGRDEEIAQLDAAYERVVSGEGLTLVVEGEEGIGKTRLLREWLEVRAADPRPPRMLVVARGVVREGWDAFSTALRTLMGRVSLEETINALLNDAPDLAVAARIHMAGGDASLERQALAELYVRLVRWLARERPLIIAVDDAHMLPSFERSVLASMAATCSDVSMFVLVAQRPYPGDPLARDVAATKLTVGALGDAACRQLLQDVLHRDGGRLGSAASISERVDGNPYFLLEYLRNEARTRASESTESLQPEIPDSLRDMVRLRFDHLTDDERDVLDAAACVGDVFDPILVTALCEVGRIEGLKRFGRLQREGGPLSPRGRDYRFRHRLMRDVLYEELHPTMREAYHLEIAKRLDKSSLVVRCRHLLLGRDIEGACAIGPAAIRHHYERNEFSEAAALAEDFLRLPELPSALRAYAELASGRRNAETHQYEDVRKVLVRAIEAADEASEAYVAVRARLVLGEAALASGAEKYALELQVAAEALAREHNDTRALAAAIGDQGRTLGALGEIERAEHAARTSLELSESVGDRYQAARRAQNLAVKYTRAGNRTAAEPLYKRAVEHARASGNRTTEVSALTNHAALLMEHGQIATSHEHMERAFAMSREVDDPRSFTQRLNRMGTSLRAIGRFDAAVLHLEEALTLTAAYGLTEMHGHVLASLVLVAIARGRADDASRNAATLEAWAKTSDNVRLHANAARARAAWAGRFGHTDLALQLSDSSAEISRKHNEPFTALGAESEGARALSMSDRLDEADAKFESMIARADAINYAMDRDRLTWIQVRILRGHFADALTIAKGLSARITDAALKGLQAHAALLEAALTQGDVRAAWLAYEQLEAAVPHDLRISLHDALCAAPISDTERTFHRARAAELAAQWLDSMTDSDRAEAQQMALFTRIQAAAN